MESNKAGALRVLLVHSGNESFVRVDRDLLSRSFNVDDLFMRRKFPFDTFRLWRGVRNADVVYCWFASWNSFWALLFAKLMKKKSVLVIGGYDVANLPEANYGHQRGGVQKWFSRWSMQLAAKLITFSNFSREEANLNADILLDKVQVIYLGIPDPFGSLPEMPKEPIALTVGKVDFANLKRKGLQAFVQTAAHLPDVQFVLVGSWADESIDRLREIATPNVTFTGWVTEAELLELYRKATVYVQASLHEGFGMSVAEAMLAGCVPVVTHTGSLPEVVGDSGYYLGSIEPDALVSSIKAAIHDNERASILARDRILNNFPLKNRLESLETMLLSND